MVLSETEQGALSNAKSIEALLLHERIKTNGLIAEMQKEMHHIAEVVTNEFKTGVESEEKYMSALSMVFTAVENGRLNDLYNAIVTAFPEYYS